MTMPDDPFEPPPDHPPLRVMYIRPHLEAVVEQTIAETILSNEVFWYDISPNVVANPSGDPSMPPVIGYVVIISCKSPVLSPPRIAISDVIYDGHPSDQQVESTVKGLLDSLFEVRRQLLSQRNN
jgi:hypothetical protein